MHRSLVRTLLCAAVLSAAASGLAAQAGVASTPRLIVAPQVGPVVNHSRGGQLNVTASLVAEMPLGRGWSVAAEWTRPYGGYAERVCASHPGYDCIVGAELRSSGGVGVMARPVRVGSFEPYAGISAGAVRWARFNESGVAPMASFRAGLDVRVHGPFALRADVVRRVAWAGTPEGDPLSVDIVSLGAAFALRR
jgi:hypothetical protein